MRPTPGLAGLGCRERLLTWPRAHVGQVPRAYVGKLPRGNPSCDNACMAKNTRIIAVANQKGGAGKTTTAVHTAVSLSRLGNKVLLVDLDAQGNATKYLGVDTDGADLFAALCGESDLASVIQPGHEGIDVAGSGDAMEGLDVMLFSKLNAAAAFSLRKLLRPMVGRYDFVIVDCPPNLGLATASALAACGEVMIPVIVEPMALEGLGKLMKTVENAKEFNEHIRLVGVLPLRVEANNLADGVQEALRAGFGDLVLPSVKKSVRVTESYSEKVPVHTYDPRNVTVPQFEAVARALVERGAAA